MSGTKHYGLHRGTVVSNKDPLNKRRLKVIVPSVTGTSPSNWAWPLETASTKVASPAVGQGVWIIFENGDPAYPVWVGTFGKEVSKEYPLLIDRMDPLDIVPEITDLLSVKKFSDNTNEVDVSQTLLNIVRNRCYGSFYSMSSIEAAANTVNFLPINLTAFSCSNVSVTDTNRLTLNGVGVFNVQFSAQFEATVSQDRFIDIWLMKNGENVPDSNSRITTGDKAPWSIASWNFFIIGGGPSDYWQIAWSVDGTGVRLHSEGAQTAPARPGIPSVLLTVSKVK